MSDAISSTARELLGKALGRAHTELADDASIGTTAGWDSVAHVRLVLAIEEHLGRDLPPEQVLGLTSLAGIIRVLAASEEGTP